MFTTMDLASRYLQVPLSESAKEKTAFKPQTNPASLKEWFLV
jgi:hypothetical protein